MLFWMRSETYMSKINLQREKLTVLDVTVSCDKTAEPIEMQFGAWTQGAQGTMD